MNDCPPIAGRREGCYDGFLICSDSEKIPYLAWDGESLVVEFMTAEHALEPMTARNFDTRGMIDLIITESKGRQNS
jgi:hypothetical protein